MTLDLRRAFATLAFLPAAAVLLPACADNESSLFIKQVQVLNDECVAEADPGGTFRTSGVIDTLFAQEYVAQLLVGNQIVQRGNADQLRTETSKIKIYEYDVQVLDIDGGVLNEYTAPTSGFVDEKKGDTVGYGIASAVLLDATTAKSLGDTATSSGVVQEVVASVIVKGRTLGGNEIESGEFSYPISVCHGCLLVFPPTANDPEQPTLCDNTAEDPDATCTPGVDSPGDCRFCRAYDPKTCDPPDPNFKAAP